MSSSCKVKFLWCLLSVKPSSCLLVRLSSFKVIFLWCPIHMSLSSCEISNFVYPTMLFFIFSIFSQIFWIHTEGKERQKLQKKTFSSNFLAIWGNLEHFFPPYVARFFGPPLWGGGRGGQTFQKRFLSIFCHFSQFGTLFIFSISSQICLD